MRFLVTIFVYAFLLDALLSAASEWLPISPLRNTVALLVLGLGLLLYALSAFVAQVPRRIVIPATLLLVWGNFCGGFPISFLTPEHAQTIMAWVQLPIAILLLWVHWHWRRSPPDLPVPGFPWRRFAGVALLTIALAPLALTVGAINAVGTFMEEGTDGYLKLRPAGLLLEEREFAKDEKRVRLVSMMHIGRRDFYEQIHSSLPSSGASIVLLEGITDEKGLLTERLSYANFAKMLGLTSQESSALQQGKPEPEATPTAITNLEPRVKYRHADIDISVFNPLTIEFINTIGALLAKPSVRAFLQTANDPESPLNREGADEIVMDDILNKRNEHLLAEIDDALKTSRVVIVPWGALHLPDVEFALKERGFTEVRRIARPVVAFRAEAAPLPVRVAFLADHPECRETLAAWYQHEWPWLFDATATPFDELDTCSNREHPPCTFVGFEGSRLVASAALLTEDVLPFPEYTPWLGSVVVDPELRGRGLGREIVLAAMEHARRIGIRQLFLWTPHHRGFYEKLGWEFVRDFMHENGPSSILRIPFDKNPANPECPA